MLPEYIVVEVNLDEFIVARRIDTDPPIYRKFLAAVGRPSAVEAHRALTRDEQPDFDPASRRVSSQITPEARVRIEKNDEGIIQGAVGADEEETRP